VVLLRLQRASVLIVSFPGFFSSELSFKFVYSQVNTPVNIISTFGSDENFAMFGPCDNFHAVLPSVATINDDFNLIDAVIKLCHFCGFLLCVIFDSFSYVDVFSGNVKKQDNSP